MFRVQNSRNARFKVKWWMVLDYYTRIRSSDLTSTFDKAAKRHKNRKNIISTGYGTEIREF